MPLWSGNPTSITKESKNADAAWQLALWLALDDFQNILSHARAPCGALLRSLSIPGGFESPPPAHISTFRAAGIDSSGSWHYHPAFLEIQKMAEGEELTQAFGQQKALRQACQDIDSRAAAILARG